jgi:hypothetical protein
MVLLGRPCLLLELADLSYGSTKDLGLKSTVSLLLCLNIPARAFNENLLPFVSHVLIILSFFTTIPSPGLTACIHECSIHLRNPQYSLCELTP